MDQDYLFSLYCHCMESIRHPRDPETELAQAELDQLERQLEQSMGLPFVRQYQEAWVEAVRWQEEAAFWAGVRLGVHVTLAARP